jgi:hypothetical protein
LESVHATHDLAAGNAPFKRWTGKPPGQARSERRTFGADVPPMLLPLAEEVIE